MAYDDRTTGIFMCPEVNVPSGHPAMSAARADLADAIQMPGASQERIVQVGSAVLAELPPIRAAQMNRVIGKAVELSLQS